ncbi:MAG: hypothetical protein DRP50_04870 [Thermotoga sp.]|nr:MAG: hypothetical protein DRP50_04870 [Thermotoga sp.]
MRELMILIKYKFKMWSEKSRRVKSRSLLTRKKVNFPGWLLWLLIGGGFGGGFVVPLSILMSRAFKQLNAIQAPGTAFSMSEIMLGMYGFMIMLMLLLNDVPSIVYNVVSENEETSLLFSLPIKRSVIFLLKVFEILSGTSLIFAFFLPFLIGYAISIKMAWYLIPIYILDVAAFVLLIMGISSIIAAFVARFMSSTTAKRLNVIMYTMSILGVVAIFNILPGKMTSTNAAGWLKNYIGLATHPFLPSTWFLGAVKSEPRYIILLYGICALSLWGIWQLSSRYSTGISRKYKKKEIGKVSIASNKSLFGPLVNKDLKLLLREGNSLFLFIYPLVFPLIMLFAGSWNSAGVMLMAGFLSLDYSAVISGGLCFFEIQAYPTSALLPLSKKKIVFAKAFISSSIYTTIYIITILVALFIVKSGWIMMLTVPFVFVALFEMAIYGGVAYLSSPKNISANFQSAMKGTNGLKTAAIGGLISAGIVLSSFFGIANALKLSMFFRILLFPTAPIVTIIAFWYFLKDKVTEEHLKEMFEKA